MEETQTTNNQTVNSNTTSTDINAGVDSATDTGDGLGGDGRSALSRVILENC